MAPDAPGAPKYKIKLSSGRILGPIDLGRVRLFVLNNHITGTETAREHPDGEWKNINQFPEIASLLLAHAEGRLDRERREGPDGYSPIGGGRVDLGGATVVIPGAEGTLPGADAGGAIGSVPTLSTLPEVESNLIEEPSASSVSDGRTRQQAPSDSEKTIIATGAQLAPLQQRIDEDEGKTMVGTLANVSQIPVEEPAPSSEPGRNLSQEATVMFERPKEAAKEAKKKLGRKDIVRILLIGGVIALGLDMFLPEAPKKPVVQIVRIRPKLPLFVDPAKADPGTSKKLFTQGFSKWTEDTAQGYKEAAQLFGRAAALDQSNVKALALLASCYINLVDSSNKDENYFSVISQLIKMSRAKNVDLSETVIADVEFYLMVKRGEAAQNRIVEYTKTHPNEYGLELFFFLAFVFHERGASDSASKYLVQIPDDKVFTPRIFYLKGQIAEKLGSTDEALGEYRKAIRVAKNHGKSHLRIAYLLDKQGKLKEAAPFLEYVLVNPHLVSPPELAQAYYLRGRLYQLFEKWDLALGDIEKSVRLDESNKDYLLELYTLRAKAGEEIKDVRQKARMFYFLGEGEKLLKAGKYHEALTEFLQAREADIDSPLPLLKIGDMFMRLNDVNNAQKNYKMAAERALRNIDIWSKYITALILSYEWADAQAAMARFKKDPAAQSSMDKLAGDMYAKQQQWVNAITFYKKAMSRATIDSDVYIAYANALMAVGNYADAPFFFALALRFDPLSMEAIIGTAKCVAQTDSIEKAIVHLEDELQKLGGSRAELLGAIAELHIQKGDFELAQISVDQAMLANPEYAYPWKIQATIHMNREGLDKDALDKALQAYESYSDRNSSDPSGYMERYKIFIRLTKYDKAADELQKIHAIYPKYPGLHHFRGKLFSLMGNPKEAIGEFRKELENNPQSVPAMLALGEEYLNAEDPKWHKEALVLFNKAMQLSPEAAEPRHMSGWANYKLNNFPGAVALLEQAAKVDAGNPTIYKRMGIAYRAMGDRLSAQKAFAKYLELNPDAPDKAEFENF